MKQVTWPFRGYILGLMLMMVFVAIDASLRPYLTKVLVDSLIYKPDGNLKTVGLIAVLYVVLSLLFVICWRLCDWFSLKYEPPLRNHIASTLIEYVREHSHRFYQDHFAGSIASKVQDATALIPSIMATLIYRFFTEILVFMIAFYAFWQIHIGFAFAMLCWVSIFIVAATLLVKKFNYLTHETAEVSSRIMGNIVDFLGNISSVRFFVGKHIEQQRLSKVQEQYVTASQKRRWFLLKIYTFQGISFVIYQAICLGLLIYLYQENKVTPGDFVMILTLNMGIISSLWETANEMRTYSENIGTIDQALKILYVPHEIKDSPHAKNLTVKQGRISFENVQFQYPGADLLFENKSIVIEPGQKVGLVGYSGSGKSTFVNLILRLFEVTAGRISIDSQDIREITQDSLHQAIGMIPQDPLLFHRTLMENIRYGKAEATDAEVIQAAKLAHAHEFIKVLPQGYHSLVGERGIKLSGGQRQRIAIARAILKNAPILILDEATSQLDSVSEQYIQDSLWQLMQGKTTLVIAHRLSTLLHMDRLLVFDQGKIVQDGLHEELVNKAGLYKTLWEAQVGGFLLDGDLADQ